MVKRLMDIYKHHSLLARLHVWIRVNTCPFFAVEKFIPKKGRIIDYGCGHGVFSHILSLTSPDREVYGIDISKRKIEEARKTIANNGRIKFLDDVKIDNLIEKADCITILDVLCYFSDKERRELLKKFYKILKPKAKLIIKDMRKSFSIKYAWLYLQEFVAIKIFGITKASSLNFFTVKHLSRLLIDIGFNVRVIDMERKYLYPHVAFICRKRIKNN